MSPVDTQMALDQIKSQKGTMIIGTHALFSNKTLYQNLTLVIIDEQHRFGVAQRQKLLDKGPAVDFISLSATPIPRTLALTLYQGMAVSVLSEKPKGRQPVTTSLMPLKEAKACDAQIEETLTQNKQVFIIAPRIEEDEQLLSVERIEKYYKDRFKKARIRTLHGQQESLLKEKTLTAFAEGEVDILIATTVVEVGIDIKRATLMLVYHAERFGLAQLHQLRGRLGRHLDAGECILLYRGKTDVKQRLHLLKTIDDGFTLSQKDLETRGFGTLFGLQQSGFSQMQTWPYEETLRLMESIKEDVQSFLKLSKTAQEKVPLYTKLFKTA
jgi:ATP-dependent DNA helicase RecG